MKITFWFNKLIPRTETAINVRFFFTLIYLFDTGLLVVLRPSLIVYAYFFSNRI